MCVYVLVSTPLVHESLGYIGLLVTNAHWTTAFKEHLQKLQFTDGIYSHKLMNQVPCTMVCFISFTVGKLSVETNHYKPTGK